MPSLSDHARRDAEHAARSRIRVEVMRFVRRMDEHAKGEIQKAIERATQEGNAIDGTELGEAAATSAIAAYTGGGEPQPAIEAAGKPS